MGFLKRLFGGGDKPKNQDPKGIYLFFRSKRASDAVAKVRIDKQYDLNSGENGYVWHKTIVDPKYFSRIEAVVTFDSRHNIINSDIVGGELIDEDVYEAVMAQLAAEKSGSAAENSEADEPSSE